MDRFVQHPVIGIDLRGGEIGAAVRLSVEGLHPAQPSVHPAKLGSVSEQLDLQFRMLRVKVLQVCEAVRVRIIKQAQRAGCVLGLLACRRRADSVMGCFESDRRMPWPRSIFPDRHARQQEQIETYPGFPRSPFPARTRWVEDRRLLMRRVWHGRIWHSANILACDHRRWAPRPGLAARPPRQTN